MKSILRAGLAVVIGGAFWAPAEAHHAVNAQFDPSREVAFTGMLTHFDNRAPHAFWTFVDPKTKAEWKFESVSPATMRKAGIKLKEDLVEGEMYTVYYNPPRNDSHTGTVRSIKIRDKRIDFTSFYIVPKSTEGESK